MHLHSWFSRVTANKQFFKSNLIPCQNLEKANDAISRKRHVDGRMDEKS